MAKVALINREKKRRNLVEKYAEKRLSLLKVERNSLLSDEERFNARLKLQSLPRNASPSRLRNRCQITGRARGVYQKFGLGRSKLRDFIMRGEVPGVTKASW